MAWATTSRTRGQIEKVLDYLNVEHPTPAVRDAGVWRRTAVAYQMDHARIERLNRQRELEWQEIQAYVDARECLMAFLRRSLDDPLAEPCGRCAVCLGWPVVETGFDRAPGIRATRFLRGAEFPLESNQQVAAGALAEYGVRGNLPDELRAETGRILSRCGDAGWGGVVARTNR